MLKLFEMNEVVMFVFSLIDIFVLIMLEKIIVFNRFFVWIF